MDVKNVIIVEDLEFKKNCAEEALIKILGPGLSITWFKTRNSALMHLRNNRDAFSLMILDMQFPYYDGGEIIKDCGIFVLREIKRLGIKLPTVICSSDTVCVADENVIGSVHFNPSVDMTYRIREILGMQE